MFLGNEENRVNIKFINGGNKIGIMEKFRNKYRIPSARLQNWDYGSNATYYITICTAGRKHYFGKIVKKQMQLFEIGRIAKNEWLKTLEIRPDMNLLLDEFVVMPNHFHAIIIIGENEYNTQRDGQRDSQPDGQRDMQRDTQRDAQCRDAMHCVSTLLPRQPQPIQPIQRNQPIQPPTIMTQKTNLDHNQKTWHQ